MEAPEASADPPDLDFIFDAENLLATANIPPLVDNIAIPNNPGNQTTEETPGRSSEPSSSDMGSASSQESNEEPESETNLENGAPQQDIAATPLVPDNDSPEVSPPDLSSPDPSADILNLTAAELQDIAASMTPLDDTIPDIDLLLNGDSTLADFARTLEPDAPPSEMSSMNVNNDRSSSGETLPPGLEVLPPEQREELVPLMKRIVVDWLSDDPRVKWLDEMPETQKRLRLQDHFLRKLRCLYPNVRDQMIIPKVMGLEDRVYSKTNSTKSYLALLGIELKELEQKACSINCNSRASFHVRWCPIGNRIAGNPPETTSYAALLTDERFFENEEENLRMKIMRLLPMKAPQQLGMDMQELFDLEETIQQRKNGPPAGLEDSNTAGAPDLTPPSIPTNPSTFSNAEDSLKPDYSVGPPPSNSAETNSNDNLLRPPEAGQVNSNLADILPLPDTHGADVNIEDFMRDLNAPQEGIASAGSTSSGNAASVDQAANHGRLPPAPPHAGANPRPIGALARSTLASASQNIAVPYLPGSAPARGYGSPPPPPIGPLPLRGHVAKVRHLPLARHRPPFPPPFPPAGASSLRRLPAHLPPPPRAPPAQRALPPGAPSAHYPAQGHPHPHRLLPRSTPAAAAAPPTMHCLAQQAGGLPLLMQQSMRHLRGQQQMARNMHAMQQYMYAMSRNMQMMQRQAAMQAQAGGYMQAPLAAGGRMQMGGGVPTGFPAGDGGQRALLAQQAARNLEAAARGAMARGGVAGVGGFAYGLGQGSVQQAAHLGPFGMRQTVQPLSIASRGRVQGGPAGILSDPMAEMQRLLERHHRGGHNP